MFFFLLSPFRQRFAVMCPPSFSPEGETDRDVYRALVCVTWKKLNTSELYLTYCTVLLLDGLVAEQKTKAHIQADQLRVKEGCSNLLRSDLSVQRTGCHTIQSKLTVAVGTRELSFLATYGLSSPQLKRQAFIDWRMQLLRLEYRMLYLEQTSWNRDELFQLYGYADTRPVWDQVRSRSLSVISIFVKTD